MLDVIWFYIVMDKRRTTKLLNNLNKIDNLLKKKHIIFMIFKIKLKMESN